MLLKTKNECLKEQDKNLLSSLKSHSIVAVFDVLGRIIYANTNFSKLFGSTKEVVGNSASSLLRSLSHCEAPYSEICNVIRAGKDWKGMLFHNENSDKIYWLDTAITSVKNDDGEVIEYVVISNDISAYYRKGTENRTILTTEKFSLENITREKLFITKNGKIFNAAPTNFNYKRDLIVGSFVYDYVDVESRPYLQKQIEKVFADGKTNTYQSVGLTAKVNQSFFITQIKPVFNLQNEVIYATLKSKKHKNNTKFSKQFKAIEKKYSNIFQSINAGIIVVANGEGNIIEWNKGAENFFGYKDSEIIGEHLRVLISENHLDTGLKDILKAKSKIDNNLFGENIEMLAVTKNGQDFPVEFTISEWQNGKEKFYCAIMLDITKRKKLEEKIKKTTKDLELFLYRSAHDLKAPLTSAEGLLSLLKEEKVNKKVSLMVEMLDVTLKKGRSLLDDMAFASIISEKSRDITIINFKNKINTVLNACEGMEKFKTIEFHVDIQEHANFFFNKELVGAIFQNLIQNAICFSKAKTDTHSPEIHVTIKSTEKEMSILVSDNGIGISEENINKVFDLYFKARNDASNGTGLGLYILKRITDNFDGSITVKSKLDIGTSFEVILPNLKEETPNYD